MPLVLVVDDRSENCFLLAKLLGFTGIEARCACCGKDAVAAMAERVPEVVLLDVMMPDMDGFEVLAAIRGEPRYDGVSVLMYTTRSDAETRTRAAGLGANGYIVKGTPFDVIRAEVCRHLPVQ